MAKGYAGPVRNEPEAWIKSHVITVTEICEAYLNLDKAVSRPELRQIVHDEEQSETAL